jgi:aspartate racemase
VKTIGLIGGTSWVSTLEYYRIINQQINKRLSGANSAKCLIHSFNFAEILEYQYKKDNASIYNLILKAAEGLVNSGAEGLLLCANTMHRYASQLQQDISTPLIHIAEATAKQIIVSGIDRVGLLGTGITMELDFYKETLKSHGITTLTPNKEGRAYVNDKIFDELVYDQFLPETKTGFLKIMNELRREGAGGIILGCTEIPLLINQKDTELTLFDTLEIHAKAAVEFSLL